MNWFTKMASLVGLGTKEGEDLAADLSPLTGEIPAGVEATMEKMEAHGHQTKTVEISVRYRETMRSPIRNLIEGDEYSYDSEADQVHLSFTPPKGSMIGIRRTGENEIGIFDHTTWMPSAAVHRRR